MSLPLVMTKTGPQPASPAELLTKLLALVASTNPGYTANLPGSLIEDISSTDVGALAVIDSALVDLVNSLTPLGVNAFLLAALGEIYGPRQNEATNASVLLVFSGSISFPIAQGFTVSDGAHQYIVRDGGIIGSAGVSLPIFAVASDSGSWPIPTGSVTTLVTSVPSGITLSVTNPTPGTPSQGTESEESYRSRVLQAGLAASNGMPRYLKTLISEVVGVQQRLVSAQQGIGGWKILVGGGDPYQVANAIFRSLFDISTLVGSTLGVTGITQANPGVVTTNLNHLFTTGQVIRIAGVVGMTAVNNVNLTITVISEKTFSIGVDTTGYGAYVSGGVVTPNLRNVQVSISDVPDIYSIVFVEPPQQSVDMTITWNTTAINFVDPTAVAQKASQAIADYVNALSVGVPMNLFEMISVFQASIADILDPQLLTRLVFSPVDINGVVTAITAGTGLYIGDPESYFFTSPGAITVSLG